MAAKTEIQWKEGFRPPAGVSAEGTAAVVAQLLATDGEITTAAFLEAAEPEDSPVHNVCEWGEEKAAHEYRLIQVRHFLRGFMVKVARKEPEPLVHVPAKVVAAAGRESRAGAYKLLGVVHQEPDAFALALGEAQRAQESATARVDELIAKLPDGDWRLDTLRLGLEGAHAVREALRILESAQKASV